MKKFIALLITVAMVLSLVIIPVMAETDVPVRNSGDSVQPTTIDAGSRDEAVNTSGDPFVSGDTASAKSEVSTIATGEATVNLTAGDVWDFETDPFAEGWTAEDQDGDGYNWLWTGNEDAPYNTYEGEFAMTSASYVIDGNGDGMTVTPDNWLISPVFTAGRKINFWIAGQDPSWCSEVVGVYISIDGGDTWSTELGYFITTANYKQYSIYTGALAGRNIQVAFRHYDVTGIFMLNIDYVEVVGGGDQPDLPAQGGIVWDFETDPFEQDWYTRDRDGDGHNWDWEFGEEAADMKHYEGIGCMSSQSYDHFEGALIPDNWLISPAFTAGSEITFWITSQDPNRLNEVVGVYVSTDGGSTWSNELGHFTSTASYVQHIVDTGAYAGQIIQVAFRHYDVTDLFMINLDYVEVVCGGDRPDLPAQGGIVWDFETDPFAQDWYTQDRDGDGHNWDWVFGEEGAGIKDYEGIGCMSSQSYDHFEGALIPDNWLISPAFTAGSEITFWITSQAPNRLNEVVGVYVSTDGGSTWSNELGHFASTASYVQHRVDTGAYAGQIIQVAFRHYDVIGLFKINLDYVEVVCGGLQPDIPGTPSSGTISLVGAGLTAVIAGAGIVLFRKKEEN